MRRASASLLPSSAIKRKKDEEAEKDITKQNTAVLLGSAMPTSSMSRRPKAQSFPRCARFCGDVGENCDRLVSFIERQGIELVFTDNIAPALGMSYGGRIAILPGQSKAEEFSTLGA